MIRNRRLPPGGGQLQRGRPVYLFDLDNTLHDASHAAFPHINRGMTDYIVEHLAVSEAQANEIRHRYWRRYGATLLGLVRHHAVSPSHFLAQTHALPGLEQRLRHHPHDLHALKRLPGRRVLLTNAPLAYTRRVIDTLGLTRHFHAIVAIEHLQMFKQIRPKPDARMLQAVAVRLKVPTSRCVLVEDTLDHQKSARRVGMKTVWMQRWSKKAYRGAAAHVASSRRSLSTRPPYVDLRISRLNQLLRYSHRFATV